MSRLKKCILIIIGIVYLSVFIGTTININNKNNNIKQDKEVELGKVSVNKTSFDSLQSAVDTCKESNVVKINQDISENIIVKNKTIVIDGVNHCLYGNNISSDMAIMTFENCIVTIRNLTIDGENRIDDNIPWIGILIKNSTVYLDDVKIQNVNHEKNKLNNYPKGYGVYYVNDENNSQDIYINGCSFTNFNDTAIYINNRSEASLKINISENYVEGTPSTISQTAISLKGLITGDIKENEFSNLTSENSSRGISISKLCKVNYDNNTFINVDVKTFNLND